MTYLIIWAALGWAMACFGVYRVITLRQRIDALTGRRSPRPPRKTLADVRGHHGEWL
jgi:hypothetical protein